MIKVLLILGFLFASLAVAEERVPLVDQKKEVPVDSFYITREGKKYHREDCTYLRKSKLKVTMREAIENRYEPCKRCYSSESDSTSLE